MLGIALGAFTQGFTQGMQLGQQVHDVMKQRKLENAVTGIAKQGKQEFDAQVASGQAEEGDYMSFYANHIVPKTANEYLLDGQPDKAQAWLDWADQASTKGASKKFMSGLRKLQLGDTTGGIADMQKAVNTSGYGPDGKMSVAEYYDENAGGVTGYRLTFTQPDGKEYTKNVAAADLTTFFANIVSPQAAFETEQATKAAEAKADLEVKTYTRKKQAEKELGVGTGALTPAQYQNAIQEERKRIEESALTDPEIGDLSADDREQLAKDTVDKRFGRTPDTAAEPQVAVDPETGEQVNIGGGQGVDAAAPTDEALGVQDQPAAADETAAEPAPDAGGGPVAAPASPDQQPGITPPEQQGPPQPTGAEAATPVAAATQVDPTARQSYIDQASQLMRQGGNGQQIARALIAAGVPPEQWPQDVQLAARSAQLGVSQ
jgi:hypothetical protein